MKKDRSTSIKLSDITGRLDVGQQLGDSNTFCYTTLINVSRRYIDSNNRVQTCKNRPHTFHPLTLSNVIFLNLLISCLHAMFMLNWHQ